MESKIQELSVKMPGELTESSIKTKMPEDNADPIVTKMSSEETVNFPSQCGPISQ